MSTPGADSMLGEKLNSPEYELLDAVLTGALVDRQVGEPELDDSAYETDWGDDRTVRAELLADLLTGKRLLRGGRLRAVKLRGVRITGQLNLEAATLACPLMLQGCLLDEPVDFSEAAAPSIRLPGCRLPALIARQLRSTGDVCLADGFSVRAGVDLSGAQIGGRLSLAGARVENDNGPALAADSVTIGQGLSCQAFYARGEVRLSRAQISGDLILIWANLANENGPALIADGLTADQVISRGGFTARGEVRLVGARIGGQFSFAGATLANENGPALIADRLTVGQDMYCKEGFIARGEVSLSGAHIGGQLDLTGASFGNEDGPALTGRRLIVDRDIFCENFSARGEVRLRGANIGGQLDLRGASLSNRDGVALDLESACAAVLLLPRQRPDGSVNLVNAKTDHFADDPASWPETMLLRGFRYDILENGQVSVRERLEWLTRHDDGYVPQVYDQLATAYRNVGREDAARRVAIAKQRRRRRGLNPLNWLWYATVGYGYRTCLAGVWLTALLAVGTWVFSRAHMIATVTHPPTFHPFAYAVDVILPIVDLGQKSAWYPQGAALYCSWALTGAGWVLTTAVVAGLTGILKHD